MSECIGHCRTALIGVILEMIVLIMLAKGYDGGCEFCFTVQPPEYLECDPYAEDISLECQVVGPFAPMPQIVWFSKTHPSTEGSSEIGESNYNYSVVNTGQLVEAVRTTHSVLTIKALSVGEYWCEIYIGDIALEQSQKLCITEHNDYSRYPACQPPTSQEFPDPKCWDIPTSCVTEPPFAIATSSSSSATGGSGLTKDSGESINNGTPTESTMTIQTTSSSSPSKAVPLATLPTDGATTPTYNPDNEVELEGLVDTPQGFELWLYIAASLAGLFALLILILTIICIALCVLRPLAHQKSPSLQDKDVCIFQSNPGSPMDLRPPTSMTEQTEVILSTIPSADNYDTFERDYDEIDDNEGDSPPLTPMHQRYFEGLVDEIPPMLLPTSHPAFYSEIAPNNAGAQALLSQALAPSQLTGYGKLDHTRSRQTHHPQRDSPLLSGYRKLEHVTVGFRAQTLPQGAQLQPEYANIVIPGGGGHVRSNSLPNSEYSNLQHARRNRSQPSTPTSEIPKERYANFQIIEEENQRRMSNDPTIYHMLEDIPVDEDGGRRQEYEFLPTCGGSDGTMTTCNNLPPELPTKPPEYNPTHRAVHVLAKEMLEEKLSLDSQSADFTGPFFFPHMAEFGEPLSPNSDRHTYRALDVSTMEPEVGYTTVSIMTDSEDY